MREFYYSTEFKFEVLEKAERAKPAAGRSSEEQTDRADDTNNEIWYRLERKEMLGAANGTGNCGRRASIAIEQGGDNGFEFSLINLWIAGPADKIRIR